MLIGIDASRANRDQKTGTEYYAYYLIRNLAKIDKENEYILYTDKPLQGGLLDLTKTDTDTPNVGEIKFDQEGYQIIKSPFNNFRAKVVKWPFSFFWTLGGLSWEMLRHKPDILFVPAHALPLILPKRTINTIHDVAFAREPELYIQEKIGQRGIGKKIIDLLVKLFTLGKYGATPLDYLGWSTRFALKHASKIITVSEFTKNEIIDIYKADPKKIKVIHNGFNDSIYRKINETEKVDSVLEKYKITKPFLLYNGRIEKKKNSLALIEAFALTKERNKNLKEKLVLAGFEGFGAEEIRRAINKRGIGREVIMTGWMEEKDLPYLYNAATAFIFPSQYEGFGIPILQALACGTPILASRIPVFEEIFGDTILYFNPRDIQSIAAAIKQIINNRDLAAQLSNKGLERVKNFGWEKCARETLVEIIN